jgi:prepilin-type N-terminal cleavage/methylation domain-containing protein
MSLKNIKSNPQAKSGFTIVELLIVVVVIAILAAITIVSYNGITARANSSAAAAMAATFQKKAELFAADGPTSAYPRALSDLTGLNNANPQVAVDILNATGTRTVASNTWYVSPGSIATSASAPGSNNGKNTLMYQVCGNQGTNTAPTTIAAMTTTTGGVVTYYDFANNTTKTVTFGNSTAGSVTANGVTVNNACIAVPASA